MPRTKVARKVIEPSIRDLILRLRDRDLEALETMKESFFNQCELFFEEELMAIPSHLWDLSMSIFESEDFSACKSMMKTDKRKPRTRSACGMEDEGYLTAESTGHSSGSRVSRSRQINNTGSMRKSRSLSRSQANRNSKQYKTPSLKLPLTSYGTVTPKVNPNTPQAILRRPKQGEVALSLQGSPLLTSAVVSDTTANINIPLEDGRLFSIQPRRGLRMSQIPQLDNETRRQLAMLRDNLNQVCGIELNEWN